MSYFPQPPPQLEDLLTSLREERHEVDHLRTLLRRVLADTESEGCLSPELLADLEDAL
jgi:hypothetical protein